jgi:hypothetical protein
MKRLPLLLVALLAAPNAVPAAKPHQQHGQTAVSEGSKALEYVPPGSADATHSLSSAWTVPLRGQREPPRPVSVILVPVGGHSVDDKTPERLIRLTSPFAGVRFDIDADGTLDCVAWPERGAPLAFLAFDRNRNDRIDNGSELFGEQTIPDVADGFTALAMIAPHNGDGAITSVDAIYSQLLLWQDLNRNGISERRELTLVSTLIAKLGLGYFDVNRTDANGNRLDNRGWSVFLSDFKGEADDRIRSIYEVAIRYSR